MSDKEKTTMIGEDKTITIVLGQTGANITTKKIFIMDKANTITHTPTADEIIMVERDGAYTKTGKIPTEFTVTTNPTADVVHTVAGKAEELDNAVNISEEVNKMTQSQNSELIAEQNPAPGYEKVGGYRVTRRRNPRRKQKKSYRRRRI